MGRGLLGVTEYDSDEDHDYKPSRKDDDDNDDSYLDRPVSRATAAVRTVKVAPAELDTPLATRYAGYCLKHLAQSSGPF